MASATYLAQKWSRRPGVCGLLLFPIPSLLLLHDVVSIPGRNPIVLFVLVYLVVDSLSRSIGLLSLRDVLYFVWKDESTECGMDYPTQRIVEAETREQTHLEIGGSSTTDNQASDDNLGYPLSHTGHLRGGGILAV